MTHQDVFWGLPYLALLVGAKIVMPGPNLDADSICTLVEAEGVTISAGVPTVWLAARDHLKAIGRVPHTACSRPSRSSLALLLPPRPGRRTGALQRGRLRGICAVWIGAAGGVY
jgi:hypothetical protein